MKQSAFLSMRCGRNSTPSLHSPWYKAFNLPVHILLGQKKDVTKRISIRPLTLLAASLALIACVAWAGKIILAPDYPAGQQQKAASKESEQSDVRVKFAETEALLSLRDAQIESMQQQLQQDRLDMQHMQQRLDLFDQVLAERKVAGIHFLRPAAIWKDKHTIAYQLILVKGKNYPRWIIGHLAFTMNDAKGNSIALPVTKNKNSGDKIEMTTQSFIEGELPWQESWRPNMLTITLINHKGRNKGSITIPITRTPNGQDRNTP
jgi:hypothetical protein